MQERDAVSLPLHKKAGVMTMTVLKRFEFEASLMRSGVVVSDRDRPNSPALVFVRGAPTRVEGLIRGGFLPPNFHQVRQRLCYYFAYLQAKDVMCVVGIRE